MQLMTKTEAYVSKRVSRIFALILTATIFEGVTQGIILLQETIAKKALFATDFQITAIGVISQTTMIFSFFISYSFSNRNKKWLILGGYILGRLIFVLSFFIESTPMFLLFLFLYYAVYSFQIPLMNSFYQNYFSSRRGLVYGTIKGISILFVMLTSLTAGKILDGNGSLYKVVLLVTSVTSLVSYLIFFRIESQTQYPAEDSREKTNIREALGNICRNRDFIVFEGLFMTYGFAFMLCVPAVPIFMLKILKLSYFEMGQAQGIYAQLFIMLISPFAGMIYDRINLWRVGMISFGILSLYPLLFIFSSLALSKPLAYAGLLLYSLGMSGVTILWNLGTISFSRERDSFFYQGFHVSLVGIRGFIGPLLGYVFISQFGVMTNFVISTVLFFAAAMGSFIYSKLLE